MPSPFPSMDPFLEGAKFPDLHHKLASVIAELLTPVIVPKYSAQVETYTFEDSSPDTEIGITYPDIGIFQNRVEEPTTAYEILSDRNFTPVSVIVPTMYSFQVRIPVIQIMDVENNRLITSIKILSPVNKKAEGLELYRKKRLKLYKAGVHLLEIDLLRRGIRPFVHPKIPNNHYCVALTPAHSDTKIWGFDITNSFPIVPVPLQSPDADVALDLGKAFSLVYDRSAYQYAIHYNEIPPPPEFSEEEMQWIKDRLKTLFAE